MMKFGYFSRNVWIVKQRFVRAGHGSTEYTNKYVYYGHHLLYPFREYISLCALLFGTASNNDKIIATFETIEAQKIRTTTNRRSTLERQNTDASRKHAYIILTPLNPTII